MALNWAALFNSWNSQHKQQGSKGQRGSMENLGMGSLIIWGKVRAAWVGVLWWPTCVWLDAGNKSNKKFDACFSPSRFLIYHSRLKNLHHYSHKIQFCCTKSGSTADCTSFARRIGAMDVVNCGCEPLFLVIGGGLLVFVKSLQKGIKRGMNTPFVSRSVLHLKFNVFLFDWYGAEGPFINWNKSHETKNK